MGRTKTTAWLVPILAITACATSSGTETLGPPADVYLPRAHSHNDYARAHPLVDAIERGFASIEVDVVLLDGQLYVAHEASEVRQRATLVGLYLEPLRGLTRRNGGHVFGPSSPSVQLLIDVKTPADETYRVLAKTLAAYEDILTAWTPAGVRPGAVTAVLSGNRALDLVAADTLRYVALDGRIDESRGRFSADEMPIVSIDWEGIEASGSRQRFAMARELVERVHEEGRKVRFWGTPDRASVWSSLLQMDVDYIGTDDARRLQRVLRGL